MTTSNFEDLMTMAALLSACNKRLEFEDSAEKTAAFFTHVRLTCEQTLPSPNRYSLRASKGSQMRFHMFESVTGYGFDKALRDAEAMLAECANEGYKTIEVTAFCEDLPLSWVAAYYQAP